MSRDFLLPKFMTTSYYENAVHSIDKIMDISHVMNNYFKVIFFKNSSCNWSIFRDYDLLLEATFIDIPKMKISQTSR